MFFIYRLTDGELDYYGQTEDPTERLRLHNSSDKSRSKLLDKSKMKMHIIHRLYTQEEADETEAFYQLNFPCVNHNIAGRTKKEWYEANKDYVLERNSNYRKNNKGKIKEQKAEYIGKNKEKISKQRAEHYQRNKEQHNKKTSEYYKKNKEKIAEQRSEPYECECGSVIRKDSKSAHIKSKKHQNYINQK